MKMQQGNIAYGSSNLRQGALGVRSQPVQGTVSGRTRRQFHFEASVPVVNGCPELPAFASDDLTEPRGVSR